MKDISMLKESGKSSSVLYEELESLFDPLSAPSHDELVEVVHYLQDIAPVYHWKRFDMWVVSRYSDVDAVLRDARLYTAKDKLSDRQASYRDEVWEELKSTTYRKGAKTLTLGTADGFDHQRLRDPFKAAFQPRSIASYEATIRQICEGIVAEILPAESAEWLTDFAKPFPMRAILSILGLPIEDAELLAKYTESLIELTAVTLEPKEQVVRARDVALLEEYVRNEISLRRQTPEGFPGLMNDVVQMLTRGDAQMSEDELIQSFTIEMLVGGHETVAATLVTSLRSLLQTEGLWLELQQDPKLIPNAVEEFLRITSPIIGLFRRSTADSIVSGVTIPANSLVYWLNFSANHDPRKFEEADVVDIHRRNASSHLTFGKGVHNCIGAPLARLELKVAYEVLTDQLRGMRLVPGQGELTYKPSLRLRPPEELHVQWENEG